MHSAFTPRQAQRQFDRVLERAQDLSTLPSRIGQVLKVANDPASSASDLAKMVEQSPAIAARVIRSANSVLNGMHHPAKDLPQAIAMLGFVQVRNLAVTAMVSDVFADDRAVGRYSRHGLWRHLVSVASTARMLAERQGVDNPEEVFLAGLLHDMGIILEDQVDHEGFERLMLDYPEGLELIEAERLFLGYDHAALGAEVASRWNFPPLLVHVMAHHHDADLAGPMGQELACVELANAMVSLHGITSVGIPHRRISPAALNHLDLRKTDIHALVEAMEDACTACQPLVDLVRAA